MHGSIYRFFYFHFAGPAEACFKILSDIDALLAQIESDYIDDLDHDALEYCKEITTFEVVEDGGYYNHGKCCTFKMVIDNLRSYSNCNLICYMPFWFYSMTESLYCLALFERPRLEPVC